MKLGGKLMEALRTSNSKNLQTIWKHKMEERKNQKQQAVK